ncbi:peroxisomal acyl-coenzyme A oxidase 1-like [Haliotis asinina]|uniref:peroxisomal acyl-coenzyme A oxidase 1-like n=1 Tax=Haliotis asinina TaxID=109174 RepID=UPI0035319D35
MASSAVNPDLARERTRATFDPIQLTYVLYDGPEKVRRNRYLQSLAINDPVIANSPDWHTLSREQKYEEVMRKTVYYTKRIEELGLTKPEEIFAYREAGMAHENSAFGLHGSMFIPTIEKMGTEEQKQAWIPRAKRYEIIGTYAQTELGHGTFVRGLETTATYDPKNKEFVINSPNLTSIKFWPGALGKTSNYCVVMAQLLTQGQNCGIQAFIVPLRRLDNHQTLPGVTVGDIGTKFGYESIDNGFLKFSHVRIPRMNMLMRYAKVLEDGTFIKPDNEKLVYGSMVFIRSVITNDCARSLGQACTIAIRYSAVRRQTEVSPKGEEAQVLDYQTQQYRVFPCLATSYALWFAGRYMVDVYLRVTEQIEKGALEELPQLHGLSSGLKAFSSWAASRMMEECRMSCGGHGYLNASGFSKIYVDLTPACTYEGENVVMMLQSARFLLKCFAQAKSGAKLPGLVSCLNRPLRGSSSIDSRLELSALFDAYEHRAVRLITEAASRVQGLVTSGKTGQQASNQASVQLVAAANAFCHVFVLKTFMDKVSTGVSDTAARAALNTLCHLYAVYGIITNLGEFMIDGYISSKQATLLNQRLLDLLADIRPNAVAFVDAFDVPDNVLKSALGRYDGNVYEALFESAKRSKLNEKDVADAYHKHMKPFMDEMKAKAPRLAANL